MLTDDHEGLIIEDHQIQGKHFIWAIRIIRDRLSDTCTAAVWYSGDWGEFRAVVHHVRFDFCSGELIKMIQKQYTQEVDREITKLKEALNADA
jgi:hypothetical protein